ncbi:MAG: succinate dehydrogenase cytochrome b subunit [Pseudomonadota bacterium]
MQNSAGFFRSQVGRKIIMALTGIVLFTFLVGHMIGNLQLFLGQEALDSYAVFLSQFLHGKGIWIARAGLLLAVGLHVWAATMLTLESWNARPRGYRVQVWREATYASRTMVWSGPIIALFVVYHILHFTLGTVHPDFRPGEVYHNVVSGFSVLPVSLVYIAAMLCLGFHMWHGIWSMLQTLGLSHPRWNPLRLAFSIGVTAVVVIGNISMPMAVLAGIVR